MGFLKKAFKKLAKVSPGLKLGAKVDPVSRRLVGSSKKKPGGSSMAQAISKARGVRQGGMQTGGNTPAVASPPARKRTSTPRRPIGGSFNSPRRMK